MMFPEVETKELEITKKSIKKLGRQVGVNRMTDDAAVRVAYQYETTIRTRLKMAQMIAEHAGRETIKEQDLMLVDRLIQGGV